MINSDFHVHTKYCDGKNSPEEIIEAAISKGMKEIGFSGHSYTSFDEEPCMSPEETEKYKTEIKNLKEKYKDKIKIFLGIEQDYFSEMPIEGYDFVIGSVHYVHCGGKYWHVDHSKKEFLRTVNEYFKGDVYAFIENYYENVADIVNKTHANIIGHFDLITKFNDSNELFDENNERYINASNKALDILLKTGVPFEINTGAISRGYKKNPYPSERILKYISEHNGGVILSSDSHQADTLCFKFDECEELVKKFDLFCWSRPRGY